MVCRPLRSSLLVVSLLCACGAPRPRVLMPPMYDLRGYPAVGLVQLSTTGQSRLNETATQQLMQQLQEAQPGIRILELGSEQAALAAVGRPQLDPEAVRALGAKHGIQALFAGTVEASKAKPAVNVTSLMSAALSAKVNVTVAARLFDATNGTTMWTNSVSLDGEVAGVSVGGGGASIGAQGADTTSNQLVQQATFALADPFRSHWVRQ
jgi:hypothetical protein